MKDKKNCMHLSNADFKRRRKRVVWLKLNRRKCLRWHDKTKCLNNRRRMITTLSRLRQTGEKWLLRKRKSLNLRKINVSLQSEKSTYMVSVKIWSETLSDVFGRLQHVENAKTKRLPSNWSIECMTSFCRRRETTCSVDCVKTRSSVSWEQMSTKNIKFLWKLRRTISVAALWEIKN